MAPFTRSKTPFTFQGLNYELSSRILLCLLVSFSASTPKWYPIVTRINRRVKREVDCMLQDPSVLQSLTWWDISETCYPSAALKEQQRWLDRFTERGFSKLQEITIIAKAGDDIDITGHDSNYILLSGARFPSLQHLRLQGASKQQLETYLHAFQREDSTSQLSHITIIDYRFDTYFGPAPYFGPPHAVWPMKVTMPGEGCHYSRFLDLFSNLSDGTQLQIALPPYWANFQNFMREYRNRSVSICQE